MPITVIYHAMSLTELYHYYFIFITLVLKMHSKPDEKKNALMSQCIFFYRDNSSHIVFLFLKVTTYFALLWLPLMKVE